MRDLLSAFTPAILFALLYSLARVFGLQRLRRGWRFGAMAMIAVVVCVATAYTLLPILLEDTESNIASVSALVIRGQPMYPGAEAAVRYVLLYGPLTYLGRVIFFPVLGVNLIAFKLTGLLALLLSLYTGYRIGRAYLGRSEALVGAGAFALVLFRFMAAAMWGRCDPVLVCAAAVGIWAALRGRWLIVAVATAALPDLKVTGLAYAIPIYALLLVQTQWGKAVGSAVVAMVLASTPFLLPQISLENYAAAVMRAGQHGLEWQFLLRNLQYSVLLLLPVLVLLVSGRRMNRQQTICFGSLLCGLVLSSLAGAKVGAGSYHLLPHIAAILQLFAWLRSDAAKEYASMRRVAVAWCLTWLAFAIPELREVERGFASLRGWPSVRSDVESVLSAYPGETVEVGVGDHYEDPRTRYGYLTTFRGEPYTLSYSAIRDLQLAGAAMPAATLSYMSACGTRFWLIPKSQTPFAAPNPYFAEYRPAFSGVEETFTRHYRKIQSLKAYDLWTCIAG